MGGGSTRTQATSSEIPPEFRPYFERLFGRSEQASLGAPAGPPPGPILAPVNPIQEESLQGFESVARGTPDFSGPLYQQGLATLGGAYLSPESNPFLASTIQAGIRPIFENLQANILPGLESRAIQQGAFGGARPGLAAGQAVAGASQGAFDIASRIANENYQRERGLQLQAPQLLESGLRFSQLQPQLLGQVGDIRRQLAQEQIDAERQAFREAQAAPFEPLFPLATILQGGNLGTVGRTTSTGGPSGVAQGITGALGGAALGAGVADVGGFGGESSFGINNAMLSAIIGALLGGAGGTL